VLRGLLLCLLRGLLLSVLLRNVPADHAATDCTNDSVVPGVMPGDSAYHRALKAACGVCRACRSEAQHRSNHGDSYRTSLHSKVLAGWISGMLELPVSFQ
jgi:hypothetical protein